jgi:hypothetical protein
VHCDCNGFAEATEGRFITAICNEDEPAELATCANGLHFEHFERRLRMIAVERGTVVSFDVEIESGVYWRGYGPSSVLDFKQCPRRATLHRDGCRRHFRRGR